MVAVALSLIWLLMVASRPQDAVLGRVRGLPGFHSVADYPEARTVPGLLLYRFEAALVFFNVDHFGARLRAAIRAAKTPVEWVVLDASPINWLDATAVEQLDELRSEFAAQGIVFAIARARLSLNRAFNPSWVAQRRPAAWNFEIPDTEGSGACVRAAQAGAEDVQTAEHPSPVGSKPTSRSDPQFTVPLTTKWLDHQDAACSQRLEPCASAFDASGVGLQRHREC